MVCRIRVVVMMLLTASPALGQSVRVAVVDTSGSMAADNRLETAKAEILALAQQVPPSKQNPLLLVSFSDSARAVTVTDLPSLKSHLAGLRPKGGTDIASGLLSGLHQFKAHERCNEVIFLLFSDGEDTTGNAAGVAAAEGKLDALFAARSKQGLANVLFVKRWENAHGRLLAKIAKGGHAQVIDAKDLKVIPATLTPSVTVRKLAWSKGTPLTLEVHGEATLGLTGIAFDPSLPTTTLRCTDPGAMLAPVILRPGDPKPTPFHMRLSMSRELATKGKATLHFALGRIALFPPKGGIVLPQLTTHTLAVIIKLPPVDIHCTFAAALSATAAPAWSDPLSRKPLLGATVTCSITAEPDLPWPSPITVRLQPEACRILGKSTLEFSRPGSLSLPVTIETEPVGPSASQFPVTLMARADAPRGIIVDPSHVKLTSAHQVPVNVETLIAAHVQRVAEARWTNLCQGLAAFHADVSIDVKGPIPPSTKIILLCPPAVRRIQVEPSVLRAGTQTVRLTVEAYLPAAPAIAQFDLQIQPPPASGAVLFRATAPLSLRVPGPAALQLTLLNSDGANPSVTVRDRSQPLLLTGVPVLAGHADPKLGAGIRVRIRTGPLFGLHDPGPVPVYEPLSLPLTLPAETLFFFDTVLEEEIEVLPSAASPALVGSRQRCTVTLEAPFKKVCFFAAVVLSAIVIIVVLTRILLRPRTDTRTEQAPLNSEQVL